MNKKLLFGHIVFWFLIAAFQVYTMIWLGAANGIAHWLTAFFMYIVSFYVNLLVILPRWVQQRKWSILAGGWSLIILTNTVGMLAINKLYGFYQDGDWTFKILKFFFQAGWLEGILIPLAVAYRFGVDWFRHDQVQRQLENLQLKTEMAFLKSQINPHFFFNTLNSIYILAYQQSVKTADAVMRLSDIMQYMLYESNQEKVPLMKEVDYIRQLIALQELRMTKPLMLQLNVTSEVEDRMMSPLILIPFVENIFKHAVLDDPADPVVMQLEVLENSLSFYCRNRMNPGWKDNTGGIGLINVKRRLELLYPKRHQLDIQQDDTHFVVKLVIL
ncbi:histidine kinase [Chitinophaga dinghuensis]|uniref:Histidine kinase n=1 Tax=Chitinophaga dinghuensis TaxID=1539050 RepID=A0A327W5E3_9BACT|nr:sensor histidine kinase [Chitinophaga dinghuensis]RAJ83596.1 histidine kinase [Chitinophaga dinghuensis]